MGGENVADIVNGQQDFTGATIDTVYSKVSGIYAVYRTAERVMVQFADAGILGSNGEPLGKEQRLALSPLNPIRGEINGLIDGWRLSGSWVKGKKQQARAKLFDRRTADALTVALQGDQAHAADLLRAVKSDILEERLSIGRTEYLLIATICAAAIVLLAWLVLLSNDPTPPAGSIQDFVAKNSISLAASLGAIGALFSIALAIRSRRVETDLQRRDNIIDATLRIMIGATSAVVLFSLFRSNLVALTLGGTRIDLQPRPGQESVTHAAIVVAFLAGFSERLVGDFLSTVVAGVGSVGAGASASAVVAKTAGQDRSAANESNPMGKQAPGATPVGALSADNDHTTHEDDHDHTDGCLCDIKLPDDELTDDVELPEASGGIERTAS